MKRYIAGFMAVCILLTGLCGLPAAAAGDWECSSAPEGASGATYNEGSLSLWFETQDETGRASAQTDIDDSMASLVISFKAEFDNVESASNRRLYVKDADNALLITELLNFQGDTLNVLGSEVRNGLLAGEEYDITVAIKLDDTKQMAVWLDGERIFYGSAAEKWRRFNDMVLEFRSNTSPSKSTMRSEFTVRDIAVFEGGTALVSSTPADGAKNIIADELSAIELDFGGNISAKMTDSSLYSLEKNGVPVAFSLSSNGGKFSIVPDGGFEPDSSYELTVQDVENVWGEVIAETLSVSFETAAAGYEPPNDPPTVAFLNISSGTYQASQLKTVELSANDDEAVEKIEISVDEALMWTLTAAPYVVDLSGLSKGQHTVTATAYDIRGGTATATVHIYIEGETKYIVTYENDFEDFVGTGNGYPTGMGGISGDLKVLASSEYGEEHGVVTEISSKGERPDGKDPSGSWWGIPANNAGMEFTMEMDIFVKELTATCYFMMKQMDEMVFARDVGIDGDGFYAQNNGRKENSVPCSEGAWYHLAYDVNLNDRLYSVKITDSAGETYILAEDYVIGNAMTQVDLRFMLNISEGQTACIAFDNLKITATVRPPRILSVGYGDVSDCERIPADQTEIKLFMSAPLDADSVSARSVKLYRGTEEVVTESVSYDSGVVIKLKEKLRPDTTYKAVITTSVFDTWENALEHELTAEFVTDYGAKGARDLSIEKTGGNAAVSGILVDRDGAGGVVYAILTVWQGEKLTDISVTEISLVDGEGFRTESVEFTDGQRVEFALWETLHMPSVLAVADYE